MIHFGQIIGMGWLVLGAMNPSLRADTSDPSRLSWSHHDYLKGGFNSVPWVRDPFYPQEKKFRLSGIISAELAFVNGKWVRAGDRIEGYLVRNVSSNTVALMKQGEIIVLKLHP